MLHVFKDIITNQDNAGWIIRTDKILFLFRFFKTKPCKIKVFTDFRILSQTKILNSNICWNRIMLLYWEISKYLKYFFFLYHKVSLWSKLVFILWYMEKYFRVLAWVFFSFNIIIIINILHSFYNSIGIHMFINTKYRVYEYLNNFIFNCNHINWSKPKH